jgi:hypothetical protein
MHLRQSQALAPLLHSCLLHDVTGRGMVNQARLLVLRRVLSQYLRANSQACDTSTGIARWWMPADLDVEELEVLPVLEELCERGLLTKFSTLEGKWLYRRDHVDAASDSELEQMTRDSNELH